MTNTNSPAEIPATNDYVDTPVDLSAEWAQPEMAYRFLNWVEDKASKVGNVDLTNFSAARQEGVRDLVLHGLVSERRWVGGLDDGRVTYRLTELGSARLAAAREAAAMLVVG